MLFLLPIMACGWTAPPTQPPTTQVPTTEIPSSTLTTTLPLTTTSTQPATTQSAIDYCDTRLCSAGRTNIGCNNNGLMQCTGTVFTLTASDIQLSLDEHNKFRQKIASGGEAGFPAAERMATMVWDADLAAQAVLNVNQCIMNHDQCRSTPKFHYAGQNLAISWSTGMPVDSVQTAIPKFVKAWYDEVLDAVASQIDSYPTSTTKVIGHFTQVVQDKATHVGCAFAYFVDGQGRDTNLYACNYAITNLVNSPVYVKGTQASKCTTGVNPNFNALCSVSEVYVLPTRF